MKIRSTWYKTEAAALEAARKATTRDGRTRYVWPNTEDGYNVTGLPPGRGAYIEVAMHGGHVIARGSER